MRLVDNGEEVLREIVDERCWGRARRAAIDVARVVLNAGAEADLLNHLEVVLRAHAQTLCLQQLAAVFEVCQTLGEFGLDVRDGTFHALRASDVVRSWEDAQLRDLVDDIACDWVEIIQRINLVAEELHAHGLFFVGRDDIDHVAFYSEGTAGKGDIIAGVLNIHQKAQELVTVDFLTLLQPHRTVEVGLRGT